MALSWHFVEYRNAGGEDTVRFSEREFDKERAPVSGSMPAADDNERPLVVGMLLRSGGNVRFVEFTGGNGTVIAERLWAAENEKTSGGALAGGELIGGERASELAFGGARLRGEFVESDS